MSAAVTRSRLAADLRTLGVRPGGVLMVHTRMSALGHVVGGAETVVRALLDALGPAGTLMAYASWQEHVYGPGDRPPEHRAAYAAEPPVFDPATAEVDRSYGRLPERVRTWPGARHSGHPEAGVVAVGPRADGLCVAHPADDGYGPESPFARLCAAGGQVLALGAPLDTEHGAFAYESLRLDDDEFAVIAREALAAGIGLRGRVGAGECHLFDAAALAAFGVAWLEARFGGP